MIEHFNVTGPYKYEHDTHPCLIVSSNERIVSAVYITDGDVERGQQEAEEFPLACSACTTAIGAP